MKDYPYVPGWRLNKENNKPAVKHSVLMLTKHGIAEGEWEGSDWIQYRWSCKVKDSDVLYWMHLEDLTQLEKEGQSLQQEQSEVLSGEDVMAMCNQILIDWVKEGKTQEEKEQREQAHIRFFELYDDYLMQEQPEVDLEKEIDNVIEDLEGCAISENEELQAYLVPIEQLRDFARRFYELGLKTKEENK